MKPFTLQSSSSPRSPSLGRELADRREAQMRAARVLQARLPGRVALDLAAAFWAVRAVEGRLLPDGKCLVVIARHFLETGKPLLPKRRTHGGYLRVWGRAPDDLTWELGGRIWTGRFRDEGE